MEILSTENIATIINLIIDKTKVRVILSFYLLFLALVQPPAAKYFKLCVEKEFREHK